MKLSTPSRVVRYSIGAAVLAVGIAACVPTTPPATTTTTTESTTTTTESTTTTTEAPTTTTTSTTVPACVEQPGSATVGSVTLTVSQATCLEVGDVVTVSGSGYTTTGNLGTRAPFNGQPSGNYVIFGEFANVWQPSLGSAVAPSSTRKVITQKWALPDPTYSAATTIPNPSYVLIAPDGTFSTTLTIGAPANTNPNLGFATYGGSGATNAAEEILIPATWKPAV